EPFRAHEPPRLDVAREQDSGFLEGFAYGRSAERAHRIRPLISAVGVVSERRLAVTSVHAATWKDERTGNKVDLVMAFYHKDLEPDVAVSHQEDGCRRKRRDCRFALIGHSNCPSTYRRNTVTTKLTPMVRASTMK